MNSTVNESLQAKPKNDKRVVQQTNPKKYFLFLDEKALKNVFVWLPSQEGLVDSQTMSKYFSTKHCEFAILILIYRNHHNAF